MEEFGHKAEENKKNMIKMRNKEAEIEKRKKA